MYQSSPRLSWISILAVSLFLTAFSHQPDTGIYEEGMSARENGQIQEALQWYQKSPGPEAADVVDYDHLKSTRLVFSS